MKASFVDLRTKSSEILQALNRNEEVTILYRGKPKAVMQPLNSSAAAREKSRNHSAFGLWKDRDDLTDVATAVRVLRRGRFDAR